MVMALLIIDMQEALVPVIWRGDELTERIAALARAARDRHVPVIGTQQTGPAGSPLEQDGPGWQLTAGLGMQHADLRLRKTATDSFFGTDLADLLAARDVDTVIVTGVATDYCVEATAQSALSHGLDVILVSDGHAPAARGNPEAGLAPRQIIDHYNWALSHAIHPGGEVTLSAAAEVFSGD